VHLLDCHSNARTAVQQRTTIAFVRDKRTLLNIPLCVECVHELVLLLRCSDRETYVQWPGVTTTTTTTPRVILYVSSSSSRSAGRRKLETDIIYDVLAQLMFPVAKAIETDSAPYC